MMKTQCNITVTVLSFLRTNSDEDGEGSNQDVLLLLLLKKIECKAGRGRLPPYQSEDPRPTLPTYRGKEEKG